MLTKYLPYTTYKISDEYLQISLFLLTNPVLLSALLYPTDWLLILFTTYSPNFFLTIYLPSPTQHSIAQHKAYSLTTRFVNVRCLHSGHLCGTFALLLQKFPPTGSPRLYSSLACFQLPLKFLQNFYNSCQTNLPLIIHKSYN